MYIAICEIDYQSKFVCFFDIELCQVFIILNINLLSDTSFANISSHLVSFQFVGSFLLCEKDY